MNPSKSEMQRAFELHYLQQMREVKKQQKEDILDELEMYIYDALSECDCVADNLIVSEPNIESLYESVHFAIKSIKSAAKKLEKMKNLINADES